MSPNTAKRGSLAVDGSHLPQWFPDWARPRSSYGIWGSAAIGYGCFAHGGGCAGVVVAARPQLAREPNRVLAAAHVAGEDRGPDRPMPPSSGAGSIPAAAADRRDRARAEPSRCPARAVGKTSRASAKRPRSCPPGQRNPGARSARHLSTTDSSDAWIVPSTPVRTSLDKLPLLLETRGRPDEQLTALGEAVIDRDATALEKQRASGATGQRPELPAHPRPLADRAPGR